MDNSRSKILAAATEVFAEKGRHGARMEEIASHAKINKAMLYYFFSTKDLLYHEVLAVIMHQFFYFLSQELKSKLAASLPPAEKIKLIIRKHFEAFSRDLNQTKIMTEAFAHDPQALWLALAQAGKSGPNPGCGIRPEKILEALKAGIQQKIFRKIDPHHLFISILGMTLICFMGRPMAKLMMGFEPKNEKKFLQERITSVTDLVLHGILEKR